MKIIQDYKIEENKITFQVLSTDINNLYEFITVVINDFEKQFTYQSFLRLKHRNNIEFIDMIETDIEKVYIAKDIACIEY